MLYGLVASQAYGDSHTIFKLIIRLMSYLIRFQPELVAMDQPIKLRKNITMISLN
eukprot:UN17697